MGIYSKRRAIYHVTIFLLFILYSIILIRLREHALVDSLLLWRREESPKFNQSSELISNCVLKPPRPIILGEQSISLTYHYPLLDLVTGLLWCWIPKNACTHVKALFCRKFAPEQYSNLTSFETPRKLVDVHTLCVKYMPFYHHMSPLHQTVWTNESFNRWAIVRDPLNRLLSGWADKCLGYAQYPKVCYGNILAVKVTVRFSTPSCVGLGSSGAYCVCIAAALLQAAGLIPQPSIQVAGVSEKCLRWEPRHLEIIRKWASSAETLLHGRASGIDSAVCSYGRTSGQCQDFTVLSHVATHGGLAAYKHGSPLETVRNAANLSIILIDTKIERNVARMTSTVRDRLRMYPEIVESVFNSIDAIARESVKLLNGEYEFQSQLLENSSVHLNSYSNAGSSSTRPSSISSNHSTPERRRRRSTSAPEDEHHVLQDMCRMNNQLLVTLGVGHPKVEQIGTTLSRYGIHPKMTGAGGGGSLYAFLKPDTSQTVFEMITQEIKKLGFECYRTSLGGHGVCWHSDRPRLMESRPSSMKEHKPN